MLEQARENMQHNSGRSLSKAKELYLNVIAQDNGNHNPLILEAYYELATLLENDDSLSNHRENAWEYMLIAASRGNPDAQHRVATAYMTGYFDSIVPTDSGRSLILDYLGSLSGTAESWLALGHRYLKGIGVPESCKRAVVYLELAANAAAQQIESRGYPLFIDTTHLSQLDEDRYRKDSDDEVLDYYRHLASEGDITYAAVLGNIYLIGSRLIDQDLEQAAYYFQLAAKKGHTQSSSQLGYLIVQGKVKGSIDDAIRMLKYAEESKDHGGILGLGYCQLYGIGMERNVTMAFSSFRSIADKTPEAAYYMGEIFMSQHHHHDLEEDDEGEEKEGDTAGAAAAASNIKPAAEPIKAIHAYTHAANSGHILAFHRLAHLALRGLGTVKSCESAAAGFKKVAEKGDWAHDLTLAHRKYLRGDKLGALQLFTKMASLGIESAQANAGFLLSQIQCPPWLRYQPLPSLATTTSTTTTSTTSSVSLDLAVNTEQDRWSTTTSSFGEFSVVNRTDCEARALSFYLQSAYQGNGHAFLRVGDFYYYGKAGLYRDKKQAAIYYQLAADYKQTHALFNLGLMHETGDGVKQDFHLAKRFFDQAAAYDENAALPSQIALFMLQSHQFLQGVLGQDISTKYLHKLLYSVDSLDIMSTLPALPTLSQLFHSTSFSILSFVKPQLHALRDSIEWLLGESNKEKLLSSTFNSDLLLILAALVAYVYLHGWRRTRHQQQELERLRRNLPPVIQRPRQPPAQLGTAGDEVIQAAVAEDHVDHSEQKQQYDVPQTQSQSQSDHDEHKD